MALKSEESFESYFINFTTLSTSSVTDLWKTSNNFLTADPYTLSFIFPFYGHPIQETMILSGGFISLASSPSNINILEQAKIQVYEQNYAFTISWSNMRLLSQEDTEPLFFQLSLMSNSMQSNYLQTRHPSNCTHTMIWICSPMLLMSRVEQLFYWNLSLLVTPFHPAQLVLQKIFY